MKLSKKDIDHAAKLAHLDIEDDRKEAYLKSLSDVLGYMDQLNELDVTDITPSAHATESGTQLREDVVMKNDELDIASNAPHWEMGAFRVPKILG